MHSIHLVYELSISSSEQGVSKTVWIKNCNADLLFFGFIGSVIFCLIYHLLFLLVLMRFDSSFLVHVRFSQP